MLAEYFLTNRALPDNWKEVFLKYIQCSVSTPGEMIMKLHEELQMGLLKEIREKKVGESFEDVKTKVKELLAKRVAGEVTMSDLKAISEMLKRLQEHISHMPKISEKISVWISWIYHIKSRIMMIMDIDHELLQRVASGKPLKKSEYRELVKCNQGAMEMHKVDPLMEERWLHGKEISIDFVGYIYKTSQVACKVTTTEAESEPLFAGFDMRNF
jgi:hypothetical protein